VRPTRARWIDRGIVLVGTATLAAIAYDVPSKHFWDKALTGRPYLRVLLLVAVGVFAAFEPFQLWAARSGLEQQVTLRRHILTTLGELLDIAQTAQPPVPVKDLGLHVWKVRRGIRHPIQPRLIRVASYRLGATPVQVPFEPKKGEGVVGLCWKNNGVCKKDVEALSTQLPNQAAYDAYAAANGTEELMNLSWEMFQRVKHRGAVFASPIHGSGERFLGCISVDGSHGYTALDCTSFWNHVNSLCLIVAQDRFESLR
jgi:hypothetical protein